MKILFAASEVAPFIKTGGLADVAGSLPPALAKAGHDVRVVLPLYERIGQQWRDRMTYRLNFSVPLAWRSAYCGVFELSYNGVVYWFLDNEYYFKRTELYGHYDDGERFAFFSRAVVELAGHMDFSPNIIHCNDWQTALVPIYLMETRAWIPQLAAARTVFTIHNIEYQGRYGSDCLEDLFGLNKGYLDNRMLGYYNDVNLMKGAIYASDYVTTVSPTYAQELNYDFYAHGLAGVVKDNAYKIRGILNGIDVEHYDPSKDANLAARYSAVDLEGKKKCKESLQKAVGLNVDPSVAIVACISRLVPHKGFSMVASSLHRIMNCNLQMVVLGTGHWDYEAAFHQAENQYPGRFSAKIFYSAELAAEIYSGADLFLMPSISEPCGLSQMIAMRYGAIPIVRETGGLKDTVLPYNAENDTGLGFTFAQTTPEDMLGAIYRSMEVYYDHPDAFRAMQQRAMTAEFSWAKSAQEYLNIYRGLVGEPEPPAEPAEPEKPAEPELPVEAAEPEKPAQPEKPAEAAEPEPAPAKEKPAAKKTSAKKPAAKKPAAGTKPAAKKKK